MSVLEILDGYVGGYPEDILLVFFRYLISVLEILDGCPGDIWWVSWLYWMGVLEIIDGCP